MSDDRRITAIAASKRGPQFAVVRVEGKAVATLNRKTIEQLGLHEGQPWTESLAVRVEQAVVFDKAMRAAMQRLNRRAMTRQQLHRKLTQLEHAPEVVEQVLAKLESLKLIDDAAFGQALIHDVSRRQPAGARLLKTKLRQRGIDPKLAEKLVKQNQPDTPTLVEQARALAEQRLRRMNKLDAMTIKRRLWSLLARRGFDSDVIEQALRNIKTAGDEQAWD